MVYGIQFLISAAAVFGVIKISRALSLYDIQDGRRMHKGKIPRLGGLGIFLGFAAGVVICLLSGTGSALRSDNRFWLLLAAAVIVFATGFVDDLKPVPARYKLVIQLAAALLVCAAGFRFDRISFAPLNFSLDFGIFSWPLTVLWIAGLINVINMFDGLDGLAGTTSVIALLVYTVFFYRADFADGFLLCSLLIVPVTAFLLFNLPFPKARIFMGDSGSNFLGFMLAVLPLVRETPVSPAVVPVWYAATVLVFPVCDFIAAVWRRLREHRSIMSPDFSHLHHKLVAMGFSQRQTLLLLVVLQSAVAALVLTSLLSGGTAALTILLAIWLIAILFFTVIHINKNLHFRGSDS